MLHLKQLTSLLFIATFLLFGWSSSAKAVATDRVCNNFEIWTYGIEDNNDPEIQRLINILYLQALVYNRTVESVNILPKSQAIIDDLEPGTNTYGFDHTGTPFAGIGMYGYFEDPGLAYRLSQNDGNITCLFGLVWVDDRDGVAKSVEDSVPNLSDSGNGDGNGDGMLDSNQSSVTSLKGTNGAYLTLSNTQGLAQRGVQIVPPPSDVPSFVTFPFGMLEFNITGVSNGGTVTMKLYVPKDSAVDSYWKKNRNSGVWENINPTITTNGNKKILTFTLTDGGPYDADGAANGVIRDPGGPGITGGAVAGPLSVTVPVLSGWGAMLLITLMGLLGVGRSRKVA